MSELDRRGVMTRQAHRLDRAGAWCLATFLGFFFGLSVAFASENGSIDRWQLETGVDAPSYAMVSPSQTNLNVDIVVLACEEFRHHRVLQLQLYLSSEAPLSPNGVAPGQFTINPQAKIAIDGRVFPAGIFFTEDHAVLANEEKGAVVGLSQHLLDAMEEGKDMFIHVEFTVTSSEGGREMDGEVAVDLRSGAAAVAAVRRCTSKSSSPRVASLRD